MLMMGHCRCPNHGIDTWSERHSSQASSALEQLLRANLCFDPELAKEVQRLHLLCQLLVHCKLQHALAARGRMRHLNNACCACSMPISSLSIVCMLL